MNRSRALAGFVLSIGIVASDASAGTGSPLRIVDLRCEHRVDPLGIGEARPLLTWRVESGEPERRGQKTTACRILAASSAELLAADRGDRWDSGLVRAGDLFSMEWAGPPLPSRAEVHWKVQVVDGDGGTSPWSEPARFTVGLLDRTDWKGAWIGAADADRATRATAPWLRTTFELPSAPRRAFAHVASLGYHELWLDGAKCGDAVLMPSLTDLSRRARAVTYDVTPRLGPGRHAIGLWLGSGWAAHDRFGVAAFPLALAQLEVECADGSVVVVTTGRDWLARPSSTEQIGTWTFGSYGGERVDTTRERPDWSARDCDGSGWAPARLFAVDLPIVTEQCEPTRPSDEIVPVAIEEKRPGVWRVDFGRAFTGFTSARLHAPPRKTIRLRFSEREEQETTYGQESELVVGADGSGRFEHRFDYAAARWLTIEGASQPPALDDLRGHLVRTGYDRITTFRCSDPLLQRIHDTVAWTFECLSLGGYVVDCAHRERWGYGGDAHATMETALDHFGMAAFYGKWLDDWRAIQDEQGNLPFTCPTYRGGGGPAWSGIVVMLPWEVWRRTGDRRLLERCWPMIERWLAFLETKTKEGILEFHFDPRYEADVYSFLGDWVPPGGVQSGGPPTEETRFFNNGYRILDVATAARIAGVLGLGDEEKRLKERAAQLALAVHARFFDPVQRVYVSPRQTFRALPLLAGLGDGAEQTELFDKLVADIEQRRHVDTGIHGTWMLTKLLLERRRSDLAALMAGQSDFPGWGNMLAQGATTIWEQWDGVHSRMHSSFLSIGAFYVEGLAGIRPLPEASGYSRFALEPAFLPSLDHVDCELLSPRGPIRSSWRRDGDALVADFTVPLGAQASLRLPVTDVQAVSEGGGPLAQAMGLRVAAVDANGLLLELESGLFSFRFPAPR